MGWRRGDGGRGEATTNIRVCVWCAHAHRRTALRPAAAGPRLSVAVMHTIFCFFPRNAAVGVQPYRCIGRPGGSCYPTSQRGRSEASRATQLSKLLPKGKLVHGHGLDQGIVKTTYQSVSTSGDIPLGKRSTAALNQSGCKHGNPDMRGGTRLMNIESMVDGLEPTPDRGPSVHSQSTSERLMRGPGAAQGRPRGGPGAAQGRRVMAPINATVWKITRAPITMEKSERH
ncbi:unnamed protein product, partial [Iphiclides podalirius]